jgi:hypothetical protein
MKNKELQKILKQYPADAEVFLVKDWDEVSEDGLITGIEPLNEEFNIATQTAYIDVGLDWETETQILIG